MGSIPSVPLKGHPLISFARFSLSQLFLKGERERKRTFSDLSGGAGLCTRRLVSTSSRCCPNPPSKVTPLFKEEAGAQRGSVTYHALCPHMVVSGLKQLAPNF